MHKFRKTAITAISLLCATVMFGGVAFDSFKWTANPDVVSAENLRKLNSNVSIYNNLEEHFDGNVVQTLEFSFISGEEICWWPLWAVSCPGRFF